MVSVNSGRPTTSGTIGEVNYTARRASRMDAARVRSLYNRLVVALPEDSPVFTSDVDTYASLVVLATVDGLTTMNGTVITLSQSPANDEALVANFMQFMECDATLTEALGRAVAEFNQPEAPRHLLPPSQTTEAEQADPSSKGGGNKRSSS